jgi:hypothetical protein
MIPEHQVVRQGTRTTTHVKICSERTSNGSSSIGMSRLIRACAEGSSGGDLGLAGRLDASSGWRRRGLCDFIKNEDIEDGGRGYQSTQGPIGLSAGKVSSPTPPCQTNRPLARSLVTL